MTRIQLTLALIAAAAIAILAACSGDDQPQQQAQPQAQVQPQQAQAEPAQQAQAEQPQTVAQADADGGPLKIGLLLDFSGGLAEYGNEMQRGFELAITHINAGGGVWGQPVEVVIGDTSLDPTRAVEEARRLVEVEGVHVIVGPIASGVTLAVVESVTGPAGIPTISPSATSPQLTVAEDRDFLFRSTLSDSTQGPVLARVTMERGFDNVGLLYRNDAWGQGLAGAFADAWSGDLVSLAVDPQQASFLAELQQSAAGGAQALVVIAFAPEAEIMIREALEHGLYDQFTFGDGGKSLDLIAAIGGEYLGGMYGTAPAPGPESEAGRAWETAFAEEYGELPLLPYVKETYDATIAAALAAQAANSVDGGEIRDQLRAIGGAPGEIVVAGPEGVTRALALLAEGTEIDYEGAAITMEWDANGDIRQGYVGIWRFTADESFEEVEQVRFSSE